MSFIINHIESAVSKDSDISFKLSHSSTLLLGVVAFDGQVLHPNPRITTAKRTESKLTFSPKSSLLYYPSTSRWEDTKFPPSCLNLQQI